MNGGLNWKMDTGVKEQGEDKHRLNVKRKKNS